MWVRKRYGHSRRGKLWRSLSITSVSFRGAATSQSSCVMSRDLAQCALIEERDLVGRCTTFGICGSLILVFILLSW